MTLEEAYKQGTEQLRAAGVLEAQLDAWYLLEYVTKVSRAMYFAHKARALSGEQQRQYEEVIEKRAERIPLQHITGEQEFMGLSFFVNEHVLIPRQDTEILVETALEVLRSEKKDWKLLDMCTGSGCILLSILKYTESNESGRVSGLGIDISREALKVAGENAEKLGVPAAFQKSDLFREVTGRFDMIVSNPPYIPTAEIEKLQAEVKLHDPMAALDGKEDGLYFYRRIVETCQAHLNEGGWLLFEIGCDQGADVSKLMEDAGFSKVRVQKDLAGLDRVVSGVYDNVQ